MSIRATWVSTVASVTGSSRAMSASDMALLVAGAGLALPPVPGACITLLLGIAVATQQLPTAAPDRAPLAATAA